MAQAPAKAASDSDLASIQEARQLARQAKEAQAQLAHFSQDRVDAIVDAMAAAVRPLAEPLAQMAVDETGYGVVADKIQKNLFASTRVHDFIRPMKTVGVVARDDHKKVIEIAEPFGVVAAVVPSTNPTSTAIYKILISIKARCAIVLSPHPAAAKCIAKAAQVMADAARAAGLPDGAISWMTTVTLEGTQELMKVRETAVILATGGMGLVRAAYSAGKPAYGVGPGNAPAYIERSADVPRAVAAIIRGKTFDNGLLCSSENSVVVDEAIADAAIREFTARGAHFLSAAEIDAVARVLVTPQRLPNPTLVGRPATHIAKAAGIAVPSTTRVLIARLAGVGRDYPLSIEKLCPVLSFYVVKDWKEGCERCKEILRYGGMGHTMSIHSQDDAIILEFGLHKPAYRIVVNTPTTHGSIGLTTGLDPAMTLGCGGFGGNITSDNISPRHLLNIKRLAYGIRPYADAADGATDKSASSVNPRATAVGPTPTPPAPPPLPRSPARPAAGALTSELMGRRIDDFLASRGLKPHTADTSSTSSSSPPSSASQSMPSNADNAAEFVCEDDVKLAIRAGRTITVNERTIITPLARELGEAHRVLTQADWRR